jgi:hypothetical protein
MANEYRATKANLRVLAYNDSAKARLNHFRVEVWRSVATASGGGGASGSRRMQIPS